MTGFSCLTRKGGNFFITSGSGISWLQRVETTQAENLVAAWRRRKATNAASSYEDKVRLTCLDGAGANWKAEIRITAECPDFSLVGIQ